MRIRVAVLLVMLLVGCGLTCLAATSTIQAVNNWRQDVQLSQAGDVHLIHYWMTIPSVAHLYHVPENYLFQSLRLKSDVQTRRNTLENIAIDKKQPVSKIITTLQKAVETYRSTHPVHPTGSHVMAPVWFSGEANHLNHLVMSEQDILVYNRLFMPFIQHIPNLALPRLLWWGERNGGRGGW